MEQGPGGTESRQRLLRRVGAELPAVGRGEPRVDRPPGVVQRRRVEVVRRAIRGEDPDGIGAEQGAEVGHTLRHGGADEGAHVEPALQHGAAEVDAVGDVRREHQDVGVRGADLVEHRRPVRHVRVVGDIRYHRDAFAPRLLGRRRRHRGRVAVEVVDDRHAQRPGGPIELRRQHRGGEVARHRAEIRTGGADPEDQGIAAPGQLISDRAGLPVEQASRLGGGADRHRQAARVGPQDALRALLLELVDPGLRIGRAGQVLGQQRDRHAVDATVGVHEVAGDLHSGEFLLRQRRLRAGEGKHRADLDGAGGGGTRRRRRAGGQHHDDPHGRGQPESHREEF